MTTPFPVSLSGVVQGPLVPTLDDGDEGPVSGVDQQQTPVLVMGLVDLDIVSRPESRVVVLLLRPLPHPLYFPRSLRRRSCH